MHEDNGDDDDEEYICRMCPPPVGAQQEHHKWSLTPPRPLSPHHTMITAGIGILTEFATDILLYWVPILFSFIILVSQTVSVQVAASVGLMLYQYDMCVSITTPTATSAVSMHCLMRVYSVRVRLLLVLYQNENIFLLGNNFTMVSV